MGSELRFAEFERDVLASEVDQSVSALREVLDVYPANTYST